MRVIDSHFHWFPRSHFESMIKHAAYPRVEREGDGYAYLYNEGRGRMSLPAVWFDLDAGLAVTDEVTGPDTEVICTTGVLTGLADMMPVKPAYQAALAYNEAIAAAQRERRRVHGSANIPLHETSEAVALLDYSIGELGLRGVNLPARAGGGGTIDDRRLDPFYARVEELGIPLLVHPTDFAFSEILAGYGGALHLTLGRLFDSSVTVLRLVFGGVMERFPDLKVVHSHAGGLNPYQAGRIDKNSRAAGLPQPASVYMKRMFVDTVAPQALTVETAVKFYGADRVLYGTDYPCWSPQAARNVIDEAQLSDRQREMILGANSAAVFGLTPAAAAVHSLPQ